MADSKKTSKTTTIKTTKNKQKKVAKATKKYVKQEIHKTIENKTVQFVGGLNLTNYADSASLNATLLTPYTAYLSIAQGTGQGERTGNKIKIMKLSLYFMMNPNPYTGLLNNAPKPLLIRLFIGYERTSPTVTPTNFSQLFQFGNASQAPNNFIVDMFRPINKDKFVCKSFLIKLGNADYTGTVASATYQYYSNNDFKLNVFKKINLMKYINKTVTYNDTTANPTSRGLWMWYQVVNCDNTPITGTIPGQINYVLSCEYEDA